MEGDLTKMISAARVGDLTAANELLEHVYAELKRIANSKMVNERVGHSLNATALVHEAYMRMVGREGQHNWKNRAHFFAVAAESMRRILVENARRRTRLKRGGEFVRVELSAHDESVSAKPEDVLAIDDAIGKLADEDKIGAEIVKLRYFAGLSVEEAAEALGLSRAKAYRHWKFTRAWLQCELSEDDDTG